MPARLLFPPTRRIGAFRALLANVCALMTGLASGHGAVPTNAEYAHLVEVLAQVRSGAHWPVLGATPDAIDETFGPRRQPSTDLYDWHRGIDLDSNQGTTREIVAIRDGEFYRYSELSSSSGWTLVLKHALPEPVPYGGRNLSHFYTYAMHLDNAQRPAWLQQAIADDAGNPSVKRAVTAGTVVATMGSSGTSGGADYDVHLHFEVRVGSVSSLEFQLANPGTTQWGFDPHFHPLLVLADPTVSLAITRLARPTPLQAGRFRVTVDNDDYPGLNRFTAILRDHLAGGVVVRQHVLDLNRRLGFDATSTAALDSRDTSQPYLDPLYFTEDQTDFAIEWVVPTAWAADLFQPGRGLELAVEDLWGHTATHTGEITTALESWRYQHFSTLEESGPAADLANPAGDGLPNLLKYAFGLDPHAVWTLPADPEETFPGLPRTALEDGETRRLVLTFPRRTTASRPDITYTVEARDGTGLWQPAAGSESVTPHDGLWERVVWRDAATLTPGPARLLRVRVERLP